MHRETTIKEPALSKDKPDNRAIHIRCNPHLALWAKTAAGGRWGVTVQPGDADWHPLLAHMIDVAMVALRMWQYVLPPVVKQQLQASMGLGQPDDAGRWIAFFAGLHDIGKGSPPFAYRWPGAIDRLEAAGLRRGGSHRVSGHGVASACIIGNLLPEWGLAPESALAIGYAVGGHHGLFPDAKQVDEAGAAIGGRRWQQAQRDLVQALAAVLGLNDAAAPPGNLLADSAFLIRLAGLTSVADWIGSNHDYFPFVGEAFCLRKYPRRSRWQALKALIDLGWFDRPPPTVRKPFDVMFPSRTPNELQQVVADVVEDLDGPSLLVIEYPMGGGKTEAALYAASALQAKAGHDGMYMAMPTMATSNQMFSRVRQFLTDNYPDQRIGLQLIHGRADLNPEFARLGRLRPKSKLAPIAGGGHDPQENVIVAEWFTPKKQALLAPVGIGTVDQALLAALDTKHYFVRLFGLAGKVVILDEVHAYDTYMQSLLAHLLTWLAACGSSVIVLSATLPRRTRSDLLSAYAKGLGVDHDQGQCISSAYPRLSWLSRCKSGDRSIPGASQRVVNLRKYSTTDDAWMAELQKQLEAGGCAAVICNTVGRAQETYQSLQRYFAPDELMLFHARYPFADRMARELQVLERFGPGQHRPHRLVCVATQVIEQSLDIDFDLMISELAPADLVLQRSGRIWRHGRHNRPGRRAGRERPELWLLMPALSPHGVPEFSRATLGVYDAHVLLRSYWALKDVEALYIPAGVEDLIEAVYSPGEPPPDMPPAVQRAWRDTAERQFQVEQGDRRLATVRHTPRPEVELIDYRLDAYDDSSEDLHANHPALTRLGGPAVDVVCLYERSGKLYLTLSAPNPVDIDDDPNPEALQALLGRSLRVNFDPGLVRRILDMPVPAAWQHSAHLHRHRLLVFGPDGSCLTGGLSLRLDPELGLLYRTADKEVKP